MTYAEARAEAQRLANEFGYDYGVEAHVFGFHHFMLPQARHRFGHELRCEIVHPENLAKCQPGHGPTHRVESGVTSPLSLVVKGPLLSPEQVAKLRTRREHCPHCDAETRQSFEEHQNFSSPHYNWRCDECQKLVESGDIKHVTSMRKPRTLDDPPPATSGRKPRVLP